jgi:RNA-directed DNA polymerase
MDDRPRKSKSVLEPSVRKDTPRSAGKRSEPGCELEATGYARQGRAASESRSGKPSVSPGAKPTTYHTTGRSSEHGNLDSSATAKSGGKPPGPAKSRAGGGASVVVRARESREHGEGRQSIGAASAAQGKAVYAATKPDREWLLSVQRKLHQRSRDQLQYVFHELWGLVTDPRNLRCALHRVARNRGHRTPGVDGLTVAALVRGNGVDGFVQQLREDMRRQAYKPRPARRVLIPKPGQTGKKRPLGIPTVTDRVVQAALKNILEPIFEADFYPSSYGFRPGRGSHGALEHLRLLLRPRPARGRKGKLDQLPYQWAVEGDIKGCFDNIGHHALMNRIRRRVSDHKVCRIVVTFLKAGVMHESQFTRTDSGTPQGGILSPLLANIALSAIEERYERHVWPRHTPSIRTEPADILRRAKENRGGDKRRGLPVFYLVRYADDFILLISAPPGTEQQQEAERIAQHEKAALASYLMDHLGLELSEAKTLVTPVTRPMRFLGHHIRCRPHPRHKEWVSASVIPKDRSQLFRERIKALFSKASSHRALRDQIRRLNPMLRGWANFYRHAWGAKKVFNGLDHYVWWTIARWLKKKHRLSLLRLGNRYGWKKPGGRALRWQDAGERVFEASSITVEQYKLGWMQEPYFAKVDGEPGA